ncbi:MAG: NfeD family protein [Phycisphaerae bacterium]|nr:NfeD family protein [Phycisphaerae bacterium]MBN8596417.1 NfeD family protein [Planctomycetota bacterium]
MLELFFGDNAGYFALPAALGTAFFLFRLVFLMLGHAHGMDFDSHVDPSHPDPGEAFKLLSLQSVSTFSMGFGWGGLGAYRGGGMSWQTSVLVAIVAGVGMVWLLALMLKAVFDMQQSGNITLDSALGGEGEVYVSIPAAGQGSGQVRLVLNERMRIVNAKSEGQAIGSTQRVRVVRVHQDNTVGVVALDA